MFYTISDENGNYVTMHRKCYQAGIILAPFSNLTLHYRTKDDAMRRVSQLSNFGFKNLTIEKVEYEVNSSALIDAARVNAS